MTGFSDIPGAVVEDGILIHRGNPLAEQRDLASGAAVVPLANRAPIRLTGTERLRLLDAVSSQKLDPLVPGTSTETLVLDPQGRIEYAAAVLEDGIATWLITSAEAAPGLADWLTRMRFRLDVQIDAATGYSVLGGTVAAVQPYAATEGDTPVVWADPWPQVSDGGWAYGTDTGETFDWAEAVVDAAGAERLRDRTANGTQLVAGTLAAEALRIGAHRPGPDDLDPKALPHEFDWLRTAVHLSKGCYRGQETVAKVHNLGHPPRRLVALQLDGSDAILPEPGAEIRMGDTVVGRVTSAARHWEQGPIALGLVRRTTPVDEDLIVDTAAGAVAAHAEVIVPPDAGAVAQAPSLPRLSQRG